jgi:membrane-associated phospholipid phosphatase
MSDNIALRNWLFAFAATTIAVLACIGYVERPVAEFFDGRLRHTTTWSGLTARWLLSILLVVTALLFLFGCGTWVMSGRLLSSWTRTPLLCSWAAIWATAADIILKHIFGRAWPDLTYIHNHLYGFRLRHGGPHWQSFPSGTAAISAAIVSVLWIVKPRRRATGVLTVSLLCVAVVITNFHWVGDVIAGTFLGTSIGWMTVQLAPPARLS